MTGARQKNEYEVGRGKPPVSTRFQKGQSGNPSGRPRGRKKELPYESVLGQMVTVRERGGESRVTAAEAFLLMMMKSGLEGNSAAARITMEALENARASRGVTQDAGPDRIEISFVEPGSVNTGLVALGMGRKLDRFRPSARMMLEPWLVQKALDRLGGRRLTKDQQETVVKATRTPHKVNWPDWWRVRP